MNTDGFTSSPIHKGQRSGTNTPIEIPEKFHELHVAGSNSGSKSETYRDLSTT